MKRFFSLVCAVFLLNVLSIPVCALSASDVVSETAILMDADTGQVLFDKGMHRRMFPASTTKVMTALLVCENSDPDEMVTVRKSAIDIDEWESSHIALQPGEQASVDELLYALMLPSANDAANALAEHVAGSQKAFAEMMTERAQQLGAVQTRFSNAHGLHEPTHYTTAYDIALITTHAMQNPQFQTYFGTALHTMPPTNLQTDERYFTNMQYMVVEETQYYNADVLGGKVGYTDEAKHTMTTVARRNGRTLVCVVLRSTNRWEKFQDTQALLDYGFDEFRPITLPPEAFLSDSVPMDEDAVSFFSDREFTALLRKDLDANSIRVNYQLPERFQGRDRLPDSVEVVIDTDERTLPAVLGTQPIFNDLPPEPETIAVTKPASANEQLPQSSPHFQIPPWAVPVILALLFLIVGIFVLLHVRQHRRRHKRLKQLRRMRGNQSNQKSA